MTRKYILLTVISLIAIIAVSSCGHNERGRVLCVSVEPQRTLLAEIVGDKYDVVTLMGKNTDAESFEPTMKTRMALDNATAYFTTGLLPFESRLTSTAGDGLEVVDTSDGIDLIYGTHDHHNHEGECGHGHHGTADPHIWVSIRNARIIASTMARKMEEIDAANADYYRERHARLDARLDSLDRAIAARLEGHSGAFAVWHPSLTYFARDYGFNQIAVGFENKEMSAKRLSDVGKHIVEDSVRVFFIEKGYDSRQCRPFTESLGVRTVTINPMDADFENQLSVIADELSR